MTLAIQNTFIKDYLEYVRRSSESPELFHVWCAIAGAGALAVRGSWLDLGSIRHYPNQYVVLVGPSSARKTSAMRIMKHLISTYSYAKYSPTDTAGARQGLLAALRGEISYGDSEQALSAEFSEEALMDLDMSAVDEEVSELFVYSPQFSSFLGQKQFDLLQCLSFCYKNPDEYSYRLKTTEEYVSKPTISILSACSPETLYSCLPNNASGMNFVSKCMLVYGVKSSHSLPRPKALSKEFAEDRLVKGIQFCRRQHGAMKETPEAEAALDELYEYEPRMTDSRFMNYASLRFTHLCKAVVCLALLDQRNTITAADVEDAQIIIEMTEDTMSSALGEYGLNPTAIAKQRIMEIIDALAMDKFLTADEIYNLINRDVTRRDFQSALNELHATDKIVRMDSKTIDGTRQIFKYTAIQRLSPKQKSEILSGKKVDWDKLIGKEKK